MLKTSDNMHQLHKEDRKVVIPVATMLYSLI